MDKPLLERCHDFIQDWSMGNLPTTEDTYARSVRLRLELDAALGYCPEYEPELRQLPHQRQSQEK